MHCMQLVQETCSLHLRERLHVTRSSASTFTGVHASASYTAGTTPTTPARNPNLIIALTPTPEGCLVAVL